VTKTADTPQAAVFLDSLSQEPAKSIFEMQGFTVKQ
jgi:molybdate transport system substrate-binding protein